MDKKNKKMFGWVLLIAFFALHVSGLAEYTLAQIPGETEPVSSGLLEHAYLENNWQVNLPVKNMEKVDRMYSFGKYLYVLTNQNYLFCIDKEKGTIRFDIQLTAMGLPVSEPYYYSDKLWFMVGNQLLVLNPAVGSVTESKNLDIVGRNVVCSPVRNSKYIFLAGSDKRLHAIVADEYWQNFMVTADDDSLITSVIADEERAVFTTKSGSVVCICAWQPDKLWQFNVSGRISAPIIRDKNWLYISCEDTKLYKLDVYTGKSGWDIPFQAEQILVDSARVGKKVIYQYIASKGLYAIDKTSGKKIWHLQEGMDLLTEMGKAAYVLAEPSKLVVMDNDSGRKLFTVDMPTVSGHVANTTDSIIYVSDDTGKVTSIVKTGK